MAAVVKKWCVTDPVAETIVFDWTIENFLSQRGCDQLLKSKIFASKSAKWYLKLGTYKLRQDVEYVSLWVARVDLNDKSGIVACFKLSIGESCSQESCAYNFKKPSSSYTPSDPVEICVYGFEKHTLWSDIKQYLANGSLTVKCVLNILHNGSEDSYHRDSESLPATVSKHTLKDDFSSLLQDEQFCDVTLVAGKKRIRVHKLILSARSPVFASMFQHEMMETTTNVVTIADIRPEILEAMLKFIYTDDCTVLIISSEIARELFSAADKYQLEQLKTLCENELSKTLSIATVAETLVYADMHNAQHLKQSCIRLIVSKRLEVIQSPAWKEIKKHRELYLAICEQAFGDTEGEPSAKMITV